MVRVHTSNGYGSSNQWIRRFTTVVTNQGTDITYTDSVTLGASFTINTNGVYAISYSDSFNAISDQGISVNTTQPNTNIGNIPASERLALSTTAGNNFTETTTWVGFLASGSVLRAQTASNGGGTPATTQFTISRIA